MDNITNNTPSNPTSNPNDSLGDLYGIGVNMSAAPVTQSQTDQTIPTTQVPGTGQVPVSSQEAAQNTSARLKQESSTPTQPQPQGHDIFRSIMGVLAGPQFDYKVDPNTGEMIKTPVKQTKSQLANSIVAGALTGLFAGAGEKGPGAFVRGIGKGGAAGVAMRQANATQKQNMAIGDYNRRAGILESNLRLRQNAMQVSQMDYKIQQEYANDGNLIASSLEDQPGAFLEGGQNFTASQMPDLLKKYNVTTDMAIPVGVVPVMDPKTGKPMVDEYGAPKHELTYKLIDPNFSITVPDELMKKFVKYSIPGFVNSKGEAISLPKDAKTSAIIVARAMHQVAMIEMAQQRLNDWYNRKGQPPLAGKTPDGQGNRLTNDNNSAPVSLNPKSAGLPPTISKIAETTAAKYGVDANLVKNIIAQESNGNEKAVSKVGAKGLMQLMDDTAQGLGVKDPFDPVQNVEAGVKYFKSLLDEFGGNVKLALAAYNAGPKKVIDAGYEVPNIKETKDYVAKILGQ